MRFGTEIAMFVTTTTFAACWVLWMYWLIRECLDE